MAIIVMGVSGCGKSTLAQTLAEQLDRPWIDGDDLHTLEAKAKMHSRLPLNDADRTPWLKRINQLILENPTFIVACSALKRSYRDIIQMNASCWFVQLDISYADAYQRVSQRQDHFFPADLLRDQYAAFESLAGDESGMSIPAIAPLDDICTLVLDKTNTALY